MPYSITDQRLVMVDFGNQSLVPVGDAWLFVNCLEYSEDDFLYGVDILAETLLRINPSTGASTIVGPLGIDQQYAADLAEDEYGQLWMLSGGNLYTIDRATGAAVHQCQANSTELSGLAIFDGRMLTTPYFPDPPEPGCGLEYVSSMKHYLDIGPGGLVYGLLITQLPQTTWNVVYRIDPATGEEEEVARFFLRETELRGLAFPPEQQPPPSIPTNDRRGATLLALLLAAAALVILTRFSAPRG